MQILRFAALSLLCQSVDAFVTNGVASRGAFGTCAGGLRMSDAVEAEAEVGDLSVGLTGPEVADQNIR